MPTVTLIGVASSTAELVDHRQIGRVRHDDDERVAFAVVRHEAVAQHQVGRNRAEQLVVDAELRQIDELEPVALGQVPGVRDLGGLLGGVRLDAARVELRLGGRIGRQWRVGVDDFPFMLQFPLPVTSFQLPVPSTGSRVDAYDSADDRLNSGMYSASSSPAITMPHDHEQHRLDHRDEPAEVRFDLLVVEIRQAVEHFLQRAGRLADLDHLDRDVRERAALVQRASPAPAPPAPAGPPSAVRAPCTGSRSTAPPRRWRSRAGCRRRAASPASAPPATSRTSGAIGPSSGMLSVQRSNRRRLPGRFSQAQNAAAAATTAEQHQEEIRPGKRPRTPRSSGSTAAAPARTGCRTRRTPAPPSAR